ncbi:MAG TPA: F0F1 ATP synthase subunit epsilon [Candidatus Paceibacterota bacterium]
MKLSVYSLKKILYRGEASSINCQTVSGEITILKHHRPLLSMLKRGALKILDDKKQEHFVPVKSGFLEVNKDGQVRMIVEE